MFTIENPDLKIVINPKGAELQSIFHKGYQLEYLWDGDPAYWAKRSPLLFPIVGSLKDETYYYQDKPYHLGRHGFARDEVFEVEDAQFDSIRFVLSGNQETHKKFPFDFTLRVAYHLNGTSLKSVYTVENPSDEPLYFSIGGHPAFRVPLVAGTGYTDYQLVFGKKETAPRWPISKDGLIETKADPFLNNQAVLPLRKELFSKDALVFKQLTSTVVSLRSEKTPHGFDFDFDGFPFLGIWAAPQADFVCIEPWCGIADSVDTNQQLTDKEGINRLAPGEVFERSWDIALY